MVGVEGFEPRHPAPKAGALPDRYTPSRVCDNNPTIGIGHTEAPFCSRNAKAAISMPDYTPIPYTMWLDQSTDINIRQLF